MTTRSTTEQDHLDVEVVLPGGWHRHTTLRDGTAVLLRQIRPQDRDRLAAGLRALSPESRRMRFHDDVAELTAEQLIYLTDVDHLDHEAIVAIDLDRPGRPGIGVARYIRDPYEREVAEAAVTIADHYHGQGAATLLLGALAARGRDAGVEVFRHHVLAANTAMLEVFDHLGARRERHAEGLWRVDLPLLSRASDLPGTPASRAFLAAMTQRVRLADVLRPIFRPWSVRAAAPDTGPGVAEGAPDDSDEDLTRWLADREQRTVQWPTGTSSVDARS